jgi:hypothetical protein
MHRTFGHGRFWRGALAAIASGALLLGTAGSGLAAEDAQTPPPFGFSSIVAEGKHQGFMTLPARGSAQYAANPSISGSLSVGLNVDIIGNSDVVQQATINNVDVYTCNPGMKTAQNETPLAVNPSDPNNLVAGANDYRLYEASENRYDGSGGFYRSSDGGQSWSTGFLPGLVRANTDAPGPYESAGDPSIAAGPNNTFWYANLAFNRSDDANAVAVSRSGDGGSTWATTFVLQTSAAGGATLFNDKEWVAADPNNPNVAYVTWTQFHSSPGGNTISSPIVVSKVTWNPGTGSFTSTPPVVISPYRYNQGSVGQVDSSGKVHVVYEAYYRGHDVIAHTMYDPTSGKAESTAVTRDNDIPSPLPGATFRTNSFPAFAMDGSTLHVVWSNWNGSNADVVYIQSTDNGAHWSNPMTLAGGAGDKFFPWVSASNGKVFVSWMNRASGDTYVEQAKASANGGDSWTASTDVATATSTVTDGNYFGYPNCAASFIGDYTGIAVGSDGVAHPMWTDIRIGNDTKTTADQDPYTATLTLK